MATDAAGERGGDARDRARRWAAVSQAEGQRFPSSSKWKVTDALGASVSSFVKSGAGADGGGRGMPDSGLQGNGTSYRTKALERNSAWRAACVSCCDRDAKSDALER